MEKIFDIAKDSEKSWGVIAQGIDGNFEEVAEKINEVLSEIDGEYAYSFATGVGGIYNVSKDISLKNGETLTIGGQTTHGWLKGTGLVHDESYIGGVGGGDWTTAKQSQYLQEGYIIALGVNDRAQINSGNYELGSVSQITTYDGTDNDIDDIATYPKSFCRYYAGIIQRIKSVQPKAKIFCATPIGENYENLSSAIRDIVTKYGLSNDVYLIDLAAYIPDGYKVDGYMLNGHLSPMGYMYMAFIMNTYIDWIIRNNGVKFRDTALIGTGYKPDYN